MTPLLAASLMASSFSLEEEIMLEPSYSLEMIIEREKSVHELLAQIQPLTEKEKQRLINYSDYSTKKSLIHLQRAKECFSRMKDRTGREFCTDTVVAMITTFALVDLRAKAVAVLITYIVRYAESGCDHFWRGLDELTMSRNSAQYSDLCLQRVRYG